MKAGRSDPRDIVALDLENFSLVPMMYLAFDRGDCRNPSVTGLDEENVEEITDAQL